MCADPFETRLLTRTNDMGETNRLNWMEVDETENIIELRLIADWKQKAGRITSLELATVNGKLLRLLSDTLLKVRVKVSNVMPPHNGFTQLPCEAWKKDTVTSRVTWNWQIIDVPVNSQLNWRSMRRWDNMSLTDWREQCLLIEIGWSATLAATNDTESIR